MIYIIFYCRQERLELTARKFEKKADLRDSWLRERNSVLQDFDFGKNIGQVEASLKKQQAIAADILPIVSLFILSGAALCLQYRDCGFVAC